MPPKKRNPPDTTLEPELILQPKLKIKQKLSKAKPGPAQNVSTIRPALKRR